MIRNLELYVINCDLQLTNHLLAFVTGGSVTVAEAPLELLQLLLLAFFEPLLCDGELDRSTAAFLGEAFGVDFGSGTGMRNGAGTTMLPGNFPNPLGSQHLTWSNEEQENQRQHKAFKLL